MLFGAVDSFQLWVLDQKVLSVLQLPCPVQHSLMMVIAVSLLLPSAFSPCLAASSSSSSAAC